MGQMPLVKSDIDFNTLLADYNNFLAPAFVVNVAMAPGAEASQDILKLNPPVAIYSLSVDRAVNEAGSFSFTIDNPASIDKSGKKFPHLDKTSIFQPKRNVVIQMGYGSKLKTVITGAIDSIDVSFGGNGQSQLTIKGFDYIKPLMEENKRIPPSWGKPDDKTTYSDIVKKIAADYGDYQFTVDTEDTGEKYSSVKQDKQSDFEFIKSKLAEAVGYEVYVRDRVLHFHIPRMDKAPAVKGLEWGKSLISFNPKLDISSQVTGVEARGWDPDKQSAVVATASAGSERNRGAGQSGSQVAIAVGNTKVEHVRQEEIRTLSQAQQQAQAVLEKKSQQLLSGSGECLGLPDIEPGLRVELLGLGPRYSTLYYVTKVTHSIGSSGFKTQFSVMQNTLPSQGEL